MSIEENTLAIFGHTVFELATFEPNRWDVLISGGGATGALAADYNSSYRDIVAVTGLGPETDNPFQNQLRNFLKYNDIKVLSGSGDQPRINVHPPKGIKKSGSPASFRGKDPIAPSQIPEVASLTPHAAVFIGASSVFGEVGRDHLNVATRMRDDGSLIIFNPNMRGGFRVGEDSSILTDWAKAAHIVTFGNAEMNSGAFVTLGNSPEDIVNTFLNAEGSAVQIVAHTNGQEGCTLYWKDSRTVIYENISGQNPRDFTLNMGGGDAFVIGLADFFKARNITAETLKQSLNFGSIYNLGDFANHAAGRFLEERNESKQVQDELLRPLLSHIDPVDFVASFGHARPDIIQKLRDKGIDLG